MNIFQRGNLVSKKSYCVIGLGRFGTEVARVLKEEEQTITVIDDNESVIDTVGEDFNHAVLADATNIHDLEDLGIENYDMVLVCISSIEKSITICSNLRELGIKNILAKASNKVHERILKTMGISQTVIPEVSIAMKVAFQIIYGWTVDIFEMGQNDEDYVFILEFTVNNLSIANKQILNLDLTNKYGATIIAIKRINGTIVSPVNATDVIRRGDRIFLITKQNNINRLKDFFAAKKQTFLNKMNK